MISGKNIKKYKKIVSIIFYTSLFALSGSFALLINQGDLDLWHRLAVGKIFSLHGNVIYHDIFSYFPQKPLWVDHEWLSGVIFYYLTLYFGDLGLVILKILIIFTIMVLIHKTNDLFHHKKHKYKTLYCLLIIFAIIPGLASVLRCQAFTYLFFALWLYLLERIRMGENRLIWIFPVTTVLWANMHAGFIAGFGLLVFYIAGEFLNRRNFLKYAGILALCLPVTFINPYGIKYWEYLIEAIPMKRYCVDEWASFNFFGRFFDHAGVKILIVFLIFCIFYYIKTNWKSFIKIDWTKVIILSGTLYMGFSHQRHLIFFAITSGAFLYKYFIVIADTASLKAKNIFAKKGLFKNKKPFLLEFSFIITFIFVIFTMPAGINLDYYPVKAVEFIKINHIKGNILVSFNWGSYTLWKLYPQNLISSDGRYEETYVIKDLYQANSIILNNDKEKWKNLLKNYNHDIILIASDTSFYKWLIKNSSWRQVYQDKKSAVFIRSFVKNNNWILPKEDENYYSETKFETMNYNK